MFPVDSKILIVDDSTFTRSHLRNGLTHLKYSRIVEATNAMDGQRHLHEDRQSRDPVHLVITDIAMPEKSGFEFVRWIRTQERIKAIPVIILTSSQDKTGILEAGRLGVSHYICKPFDNATLKDKLASTWQKHGQKFLESLKAP